MYWDGFIQQHIFITPVLLDTSTVRLNSMIWNLLDDYPTQSTVLAVRGLCSYGCAKDQLWKIRWGLTGENWVFVWTASGGNPQYRITRNTGRLSLTLFELLRKNWILRSCNYCTIDFCFLIE
jgi:hypothetical protein